MLLLPTFTMHACGRSTHLLSCAGAKYHLKDVKAAMKEAMKGGSQGQNPAGRMSKRSALRQLSACVMHLLHYWVVIPTQEAVERALIHAEKHDCHLSKESIWMSDQQNVRCHDYHCMATH